jgi:hypothetical protein
MDRAIKSWVLPCWIFVSAIGGSAFAETAWHAVGLGSFDSKTGASPDSGVIADGHGHLFGTTTMGGTGLCDGGSGCGTVYEVLTPGGSSGVIRALHSFQEDAGGYFAAAPVTMGPEGSLCGYTSAGTWGTVFQLLRPSDEAGKWTFQILYTFKNETDGNLLSVSSPLVWKDGALYGIASAGAGACAACGSVFRLSPLSDGSWSLTTLYRFTGVDADGLPTWIALSADGHLLFASASLHAGEVLVLARQRTGEWQMRAMVRFGGDLGTSPTNLVAGADGVVFGLTMRAHGGTAFEVARSEENQWTAQTIATIDSHGYGPTSLAPGPAGTLIGVTYGDQDFYAGDAFELTPPNSGTQWSYQKIWDFTQGPASNPLNVVVGWDGELFGVTNDTYSNGSVFELIHTSTPSALPLDAQKTPAAR